MEVLTDNVIAKILDDIYKEIDRLMISLNPLQVKNKGYA